MSSNMENEIDYNTSGKSENPLSGPIIIDENTSDFGGINDLRNQNPRDKFEKLEMAPWMLI